MKTYTKAFAALFLLLTTVHFSYASTTNEDVFKNALKAYDKVIKLNNKIFGKSKGSKNEKADKETKITPALYKEFKVALDDAIDLFEQYTRISSNSQHKRVAKLHLLSLKKIDFTATGDLGQYRSNYKKISALNRELNVVKGYYFPLKYKKNGKTYSISSKTKKTLERQLYVQFTESSAFSGHSKDAAKWAKKAYSYYNYGDYNLWWTAHMWYHNYSKLYKQDAELVSAAEKLIYSMSGLRRSNIKTILDSNWANYTHAYTRLNRVLRKKPQLSRNGEVWANAGESFEKLNKDRWATEYYKKALEAGYTNKSFLLKMMSKGKDKSNKPLVKTAAEIFDAKNLYSVSYSCTEYKTIATYFEYVNNDNKAKELNDKYKKCDKALTKQQRRAARGGKFLVSFAPLAPISRNLQGSIQIGGNRRLHEFGIKQTNSQRVLGVDDDDFKWGGLSYYYTYKKFISNGMYLGVQARYTDRKYEQINATVRNNTTNLRRGQTFNPTETRYDLTFHVGAIYLTRFFHIEYYTGFGLGYYTFDGGGTAWDNPDFEITNRDVLNERGNNPLGLTIRMGLQIGLNFLNR